MIFLYFCNKKGLFQMKQAFLSVVEEKGLA